MEHNSFLFLTLKYFQLVNFFIITFSTKRRKMSIIKNLFGQNIEKQQQSVLDQKEKIGKRLKSLISLTESNDNSLKDFYSKNYSEIYKILLDGLEDLDKTAKEKNKGKKPISLQESLGLIQILMNILKHARTIVSKKWQQRSISKKIFFINSYKFGAIFRC
jgi:hypothetical protein